MICSGEPVERQREYINSLLNLVPQKSADEPTPIDLPDFNPGNLTASLQKIDLPLSAQTSVGISYGIPETNSVYEQLSYNFIGTVLSVLIQRRLRRELALCYVAQAGVHRLTDLSFGANRNWSRLTFSTSVEGADSIETLDAMLKDVIEKDLPTDIVEIIRRDCLRQADITKEDSPAGVATYVRNLLANAKREEINLEEAKDFADTISLDALRRLHRDVTDTKPLVVATSPDQNILENIGEWATSKTA